MKSLKVFFVGDTKVGKSSILNRFVEGTYADDLQATIGAALSTQIVNLDTGPVRLQLWDTAGQERYRSLSPLYFRGAHAAVIVFDVTIASTADGLNTWASEVANQAPPGIPLFIVGNKVDLTEERCVPKDAGEDLAKRFGGKYFETSAKTGEGIPALFTEIARTEPVGESYQTNIPKEKPKDNCSC